MRVEPISVIWVSSNNWPHPLIAIYVFSLHIFPRSRPDILMQMRYAVKHCIAIVLHCLYRKFQLQLFKSVIWFWEYCSLLLIAKSQPVPIKSFQCQIENQESGFGLSNVWIWSNFLCICGCCGSLKVNCALLNYIFCPRPWIRRYCILH